MVAAETHTRKEFKELNIILAMPKYSHSRIGCFENCPKHYYYRYVEKPEVEGLPEGIEAFMGSRVHETLEKLYRDLKMTKENSLAGLLDYFGEQWDKNWHDRISIVKGEYSSENYRNKGKECIERYYKRYHPFNEGTTLGLEEGIVIRLDESGQYKMDGIIDRLTQTAESCYEIHDYKTGLADLPLQEKFDADRQLGLYAIGVKEKFPDAEEMPLVWHYLAYDKEFRSSRTAEQLDALKAETIEIIKQIERDTELGRFPAKESKLCPWCEYRALCPNQAHIWKTQAMQANKFLNEPGVKLVNMYAELMAEKKLADERIDAEMEQVKEALLDYAKRENVENVAGSDYIARIRFWEKLRFPSKGSDGRDVLKDILRGAGIWDKVEDIDTYELARLLNSNEIDAEIAEEIKKFISKEEASGIWLRRKMH